MMESNISVDRIVVMVQDLERLGGEGGGCSAGQFYGYNDLERQEVSVIICYGLQKYWET